jgi:RNA polymerase sigma-B factor
MAVTTIAPRDLARALDDELLDAYHLDGDPSVREELVRRFLAFAPKLARRYVRSRETLADLVQVASIGLLNAIERFESERGKKFTSFAAPTIMGELKRHFRDKGWTVHVPRDLQERALAVSRHTERLSALPGLRKRKERTLAARHCG